MGTRFKEVNTLSFIGNTGRKPNGSGRRATRTNQGEYMLDTGDFLLIPPGTSHRNVGDMATIRIVLYTRNPVRLAEEYMERAERAGQRVA
ncbi:MAG TPA: hypothetical protein VJQ55_00715 [Candidatus Binatia bacterium]|nr:hypothetical protein [Candidatus Binatia bacterium]